MPSYINTEMILESISDGVFTVDMDWKINFFNKAAERITGIKRQDAIGKRCNSVFKSDMCQNQCALSTTIKSGKPIIGRSGFIINQQGQKIPISLSTAVLRDTQSNIVGVAETFRDLSEIHSLRKELQGEVSIGDMISHAKSMQHLHELIPALARSDSSVLIQAQTGTGKELVARAIHNLGPRRNFPFVALNCAALPETLLEAELFGYVRGAFTGADTNKQGRLEVAGQGTLFLDEIGEIPPAMQAKLLRVLQENIYEPLGSNQSKQLNARIIAATNQNLPDLIQKGLFRQDLYYRLNVVPLSLPPLKDRKEDIPLLIEHFINQFNTRQNKHIQGVCPSALALLISHSYHGNVRELENIIERAFVLCQDGLIQVTHLPEELQKLEQKKTLNTTSLQHCKIQNERTAIMQALKNNNNHRLKTANELGIHKTTLFRKMKKLGIK